MERFQRLLFRISLVLLALSGTLIATSLRNQTPISASSSNALHNLDFPGTWYGGLTPDMISAIDGIWPQKTSNACGIDTAIGLVNYDSQIAGQGNIQPASEGPEAMIMRANQTQGASQWGYAAYPSGQVPSGSNWKSNGTNIWGGITNIARDYGTDPRSVAYMAWNYSLNNRWFHDYIYRWPFAYPVPKYVPLYSDQVMQATTLLARNFELYNDPAVVFINGGLHAVLVSGVWSNNDPNAYFPADLTGLVIRDPEGDTFSSRSEVSINDWINGGSTTQGYYSLWSLYYGDSYTQGDGLNANDPEPQVNPNISPYAGSQHWYGGFNWVQRDGNYANGQYSPDWAYNAVTGAQMTYP